MSDIELEVNGIRYAGWTDASASKSIEGLSGQFSFSTTIKESASGVIENDLKAQDEAKIYVGDKLFLTGYIEDLSISYSANSHSISVAGRDKLADLIDSSIIQKQYAQTNIEKLFNIVLKDNGYTDIKVINNAKNIKGIPLTLDSEGNSLIKTEQGDSIASFLDRYAKKVQILITSNEDGNLVLTREGEALANGALVSTKQKSNVLPVNILAASINVNTTERYRYVEMYSQGDNDSYTQNSVNQSGFGVDSAIRNPRRKRENISSTTITNSLTNLAKWAINIRKAKGLRYDCTVQGVFSAGKDIWYSNTLIQVIDDKCQINGEFLIQGVSYSKSLSGTFTNLSIVQKGAFSVDGVNLSDGSDFASNLIRSA